MENHQFVPEAVPRIPKHGDIRKATDKLLNVLFVINILIWVFAGVYGIYNPNWSIVALQREGVERIFIHIGVQVTITTLMIFIVLFIQTRLRCRSIIRLISLLIAIQIFALLIFIPWEILMDFLSQVHVVFRNFTNIVLTISVIYLIYQVITLMYIREADINILSQFVYQSCQAAFYSWIPVAFSMITSLLAILFL